jgi:hypothetical protein
MSLTTIVRNVVEANEPVIGSSKRSRGIKARAFPNLFSGSLIKINKDNGEDYK